MGNASFSGMPANSYSYVTVGQDGKISTWDVSGGSRVIGVSLDLFDKTNTLLSEAMDKADALYKMCVEGGLIVPEPTKEELLEKTMNSLKECQAQLVASQNQGATLAEIVRTLVDKVTALESSAAPTTDTPINITPTVSQTLDVTPLKDTARQEPIQPLNHQNIRKDGRK